MNRKTYPCGCQKGTMLCDEAVHLWRRVGYVYEDVKRGKATWTQYEKALRAYDRHFKEQER